MAEELTVNTKDRRLLFFIIFSVFATAWVLLKDPVEVYAGYIVVLLLLPVFVGRFGIPSQFWMFALFFAFTGVFNIFIGNDTTEQFLKIFIGLLVSYLFYYYVLQRFDFDVEVVFRAYLNGAFIVSVIGLIQFVSYLANFQPGYDYRWMGIFNKWSVIAGGNLGIRVNSIFGEPSTFAAVIAPAMFVSMYNIFSGSQYGISRWKGILILIVYGLTFSSLGYIGIFIALILMMINFGFARFILLFIPLAVGGWFYVYNTVPDFRYRWDSTVFIFQTGVVDIRNEHGSSIVFYNNFVVATENFQRNFLFGTGLGSHPVAFEKYSVTKDIETFGFANNTADANSMLLRIISEIGIIGVVGAFIFLRRGYVRRDPDDPEQRYWIISAACLCVILLYLLRQGHYFLNGFPLFVWLYYYSRRNADAYYEKKLAAAEEMNAAEEQADEDAELKPAES